MMRDPLDITEALDCSLEVFLETNENHHEENRVIGARKLSKEYIAKLMDAAQNYDPYLAVAKYLREHGVTEEDILSAVKTSNIDPTTESMIRNYHRDLGMQMRMKKQSALFKFNPPEPT